MDTELSEMMTLAGDFNCVDNHLMDRPDAVKSRMSNKSLKDIKGRTREDSVNRILKIFWSKSNRLHLLLFCT